MKRTLPLLFLLFSVTVFAQEGYTIKVKIKPLKDSVIYLGHYYADKTMVKDTARVDAQGNAVFTGNQKLDGGIYLIVLPTKKYMELIVDKEQNFSIETDTLDMIRKMKIKGSNDNILFYKYLSFIAEQQTVADPIRKKIEKTKDKDSLKVVQKQLANIDKKVKEFKLQYAKENPETLLAKVFIASQDPEIPETPKLPNGRPDSSFPYKYFKAHYLDKVDLSDDRLLRTPVLYNKVKYYLDKMTMQVPDSLCKEIDYLIARTKGNKETFKYCVYYGTYTYEMSVYMGMDAVFVHMVDKYYETGQAYWVTPDQLKKIKEKRDILKPLLLGKFAPNLNLPDTSLNSKKLLSFMDIKSPYTILFFWDPECSHCKKSTPKLKSFYDKWKTKGFQVYAVNTVDDRESWIKYIKENKLDWINVTNKDHRYFLKEYYDIYSTPVIYLLDENKRIIAKRIDAEQFDGYVTTMMKQKEKQKK